MELLKCPRCGEEYSPSYRRCPFCEEGDHPRRVKYNGGKGGRRAGGTKQTHSARGAFAAVLVVVLVLLSWSLFGDKIVANIGGSKPDTEQGDDRQDIGGEVIGGENDDNNEENNGDDANVDDENGTPPDVSGNGDDVTDPDDGNENNATTPDNNTATPSVDASTLGIKTNVGTTLPKDASGKFDCTIKASESIRLSVSGTDAAVTWAVADASVLSISADGTITPARTGMTTVMATVGGAVLTVTVRIK